MFHFVYLFYRRVKLGSMYLKQSKMLRITPMQVSLVIIFVNIMFSIVIRLLYIT